MNLRRIALAVVACLMLPTLPVQAEPKNTRVLFVSQSMTFVHGSVKRPETQTLSVAEVALTTLGQLKGDFEVHCTQDVAADFTKENLQNYDIVAFYTTGELPIKEEDLDYFFKEWLVQKGKGVLGFHSAMDTFHQYEPYWDMIGGTFLAHPWNSGDTVTVVNHDPENPLTKSFGPEVSFKEEIYMYNHWQPKKCHVLMSLDYSRSPITAEIPVQNGYHVPVCWIKSYGEGRVYCNNFGHNESTWSRPDYLESIHQAVKWIRGDFDVDTTPNPELSAEQEKKAQADFAAGNFNKKQQ